MKLAPILAIVFLIASACQQKQSVSTRDTDSDGNSADLQIESTDSVNIGESVTVSWNELPGAKHYSIYVATDESCTEPSLVISFTEETVTSKEFKLFKAVTHYICVTAVMSDGSSIAATNTGKKISVADTGSSGSGGNNQAAGESNAAPTISISEPDGSGDVVAESGTSFTVEFVGADADDVATISLYYRASSSVGCSDGSLTGWTLITNSLTESDTSYNWTSLPAGGSSYYVCAEIRDGTNDPVYAISPGTLSVNAAPTISITDPLGSDDTTNGIYAVTWSDADSDNDATVAVYYDTDTTGACNTGTQIGSNQSEDDGTDSINFDTSGLVADIYYVCATIDDGVNPLVSSSYSGQLLAYKSNVCTWTGFTDTDAAGTGNWIGCPVAGAPATTDRVLVFAESTNQPTVGVNTTYVGTDTGSGGGTVTIASGVRLTFSTATETMKSSLGFIGASTTCSDCELYRDGEFAVVDGATFTLGKGATLSVNTYLRIGSSTASGHFATTGGSTSSEWPTVIGKNGGSWRGIIVEGTSGTGSSVSIDGLDLDDVSISYDIITIKDYVTISQLDNLSMALASKHRGARNYIEISDCTNVTVTDQSWANLHFNDMIILPNAPYNIEYNTSCTTPVTIASASGHMWGPDYDLDPNGSLTWPDNTSNNCVWNATSAGNDWNTVAKWSGCNSRSGIPDMHDYVSIPAGANQPTITTDVVIKGVNGTGGGTITISGGTLGFTDPDNTIRSDVTIGGGSLYAVNDIRVVDGATLTLTAGINILFYENGQRMHAGDGASAGHVTISGGSEPADWILLRGSGSDVFTVSGVSGTNSVVSIDGARFSGVRGINFSNYYEITKFDNAIFATYDTTSNSSYTHLRVQNSANATFTDTTWSNLNFQQPFSAGAYAIEATDLGTALTVTGAGVGFGVENDPNTNLTWTPNSCAGTSLLGYCWYLGADGDSCTSTCSTHGGYNPTTYVSTGYAGSWQNCDAVLEAILSTTLTTGNSGSTSHVAADTGCVYTGTQGYRFSGLETTSAASEAGYQRACACNQ